LKVYLSLGDRNIVVQPNAFSFGRGDAMRFEYLALLGYARKTDLHTQGWITIDAVLELPLWRGKLRKNAETNIGRYIQHFERNGIPLIEAHTPWRGPYRLAPASEDIQFDTPLSEVAERLQINDTNPDAVTRADLLSFTKRYTRATALFFKGRMVRSRGSRDRLERSAKSELTALATDESLDARLRVLANLALVRVMDRLGQLTIAADTLNECADLIERVHDPAIHSKALLAQAWRLLRAGNHADALRTLEKAKAVITVTPDSTLSGVLAARKGLILANTIKSAKPHPRSAMKKYNQALHSLSCGLYSCLVAENYDAIQSVCFEIGNILHRMGEAYYTEASRWLQLSASICNDMQLGRYDTLAEIILAKISLERGLQKSFKKWIQLAETSAKLARNRINEAWCHTIRALYCQKYGQIEAVINELLNARQIYWDLPSYNRDLRDAYHQRKFPEAWDQVLARFLAARKRGVPGVNSPK
jgi:tetratricopeptide (TPR) repeat protein